jgi:hypothetical protein
MARTNSKSQLEALRQKQLELIKKIKDAEAKTKKDEREKDQHRHLIAGAIALKEYKDNPSGTFAVTLLGLLNHSLTKDTDRALFNLPALPKKPKDDAKPQPAAQHPDGPIVVGGGKTPILPLVDAGGGSEVGNG